MPVTRARPTPLRCGRASQRWRRPACRWHSSGETGCDRGEHACTAELRSHVKAAVLHRLRVCSGTSLKAAALHRLGVCRWDESHRRWPDGRALYNDPYGGLWVDACIPEPEQKKMRSWKAQVRGPGHGHACQPGLGRPPAAPGALVPDKRLP